MVRKINAARAIFYVGCNVNGAPRHGLAEVAQATKVALARARCGLYATFAPSTGMWRGELEQSFQITVIAIEAASAERIARELCRYLEQSAILVDCIDDLGFRTTVEVSP